MARELRPRRRPDRGGPGCGRVAVRPARARRARRAPRSSGGRRSRSVSVHRRHDGAPPARRRSVISAARPDTSGESMRRGAVDVDLELLDHPARVGCDSSTTRSARRAASRTLCVTNRTVKRPVCPEPLELVVQHVAGHRVERAERLVHQQDVGVLRERAGERDPLAHAAGQLVRPLVGEVRRGAPGRAAASARWRVRVAPAARPRSSQRELDVARDREPREQRRLLEHQRGAPADVDGAGRRLVEAGDEVEQRALAAARRAEQAHELARRARPARSGRARGRRSPPRPNAFDTSSTTTAASGHGGRRSRSDGGRVPCPRVGRTLISPAPPAAPSARLAGSSLSSVRS